MSQSATIYRITPHAFGEAETNPEGFVPYERCLDYEIFASTHEGLRYVLGRGQNGNNEGKANEIFYPSSRIGEIDFEKEDLDVDDFERIISYLPPDQVVAIYSFIENVDEAYFRKNFNPDEMNKQGVYPGVWGENAFGYESLFEDFVRLQGIFKRGAAEGSYLLSYVG
jgi:hypothetical protein